jgi:hypothetical protein
LYADTDTNLTIYTPCALGARGQGGQWIILEEASHSNQENFKLNVVPMMQLKYTTLMGISTAEGERNFYTQLMRMKNLDGTPLFRVVDTGLVCDACMASGTAANCKHLLHKVSQWKSTKRMAIFKQVMKGDPEKYAREVLGAGVTKERGTFDTVLVDACIDQRPVQLDSHDIHTICVAIDPSGGGSGSDYAIVSFTYSNKNCVVPHITHIDIYMYRCIVLVLILFSVVQYTDYYGYIPAQPVQASVPWCRVIYSSTYHFE